MMSTTRTTPLVAYQFGTFHSHPSMYMYNPARAIILRSPTNKAWKVQTPIPVDFLICIKTPINSERVIILELEHRQRSLLGCGSFLFMRFASVWFSKGDNGGLFFSDTFSVRPGYFSSFGEKPETLCCRSVRLFGYKITSYVQYIQAFSNGDIRMNNKTPSSELLHYNFFFCHHPATYRSGLVIWFVIMRYDSRPSRSVNPIMKGSYHMYSTVQYITTYAFIHSA